MFLIHISINSSTLYKERKHESSRPSKLAIFGSCSILNQIELVTSICLQNANENATKIG